VLADLMAEHQLFATIRNIKTLRSAILLSKTAQALHFFAKKP
jgi:hypothetical protein